ncbi:MAG: hypothetical protein ACR2J8_04055, partial [Thermomicrobiales bacterium]
LTLLLTPKWPFRANAMMYSDLVNGETTVAMLPERMALHAITAQSIGPVSFEIERWLARLDRGMAPRS